MVKNTICFKTSLFLKELQFSKFKSTLLCPQVGSTCNPNFEILCAIFVMLQHVILKNYTKGAKLNKLRRYDYSNKMVFLEICMYFWHNYLGKINKRNKKISQADSIAAASPSRYEVFFRLLRTERFDLTKYQTVLFHITGKTHNVCFSDFLIITQVKVSIYVFYM